MKGSENFMKEKTIEIHIRVSEKEKKELQKNAKKSGLSLSAYMRKTALKQKIIPIPDKNFYEIYLDICKVRNNIFNVKIEDIEKCLEVIENRFLDIYYSKNNGDDGDGCN